MADEAYPPAPDLPEPTPTLPANNEKPKRRSRRSSEPKTLPTTEAGEKTADQVRRKIVEMVDAAALTVANQRRATAIDAPDYEAGFDRIANPPRREKITAVLADIANAVGAGLIGYAINIYTGGSPNWSPGYIATLAGITLSVIGIVLKSTASSR